MKIPLQKLFRAISSKKRLFFIISSCATFFSNITQSKAWSGYDYDNKTEIEIETGNLVREGLTIQFYNSKDDKYHAGKVMYMESVAGGTRIQIEDLDMKKERIFIMQD
jgi:hypothetical protein